MRIRAKIAEKYREDRVMDNVVRNLIYNPEEEKQFAKEGRIYLKPKNVDKNRVR